jgi:hypothetical protein
MSYQKKETLGTEIRTWIFMNRTAFSDSATQKS